MQIAIGSKYLVLPALIPSVSSFETQLRPEIALNIQNSMREPITLVSAYDLFENSDLLAVVNNVRKDGQIVFMDSGGYEESRVNRYIRPNAVEWTYDKFRECVSSCQTDLVATFDLFMTEGQAFTSYQDDVLSLIQDHNFIPNTSKVPVVHLQDKDGKRFLSHTEAVDLIARVAQEFEPPFVAVPERELGDGLPTKIEFVAKIAHALNQSGGKTHLHVLGCGNPLSFALLAGAGAALADGLEWCRTLVGPDFKLHHFQQSDLFNEPENDLYNATVEFARDRVNDYRTKVAIRNLHALQKFNLDVQNGIATGKLNELLREHFGDRAASYAMG